MGSGEAGALLGPGRGKEDGTEQNSRDDELACGSPSFVEYVRVAVLDKGRRGT